MEIKLKVCNLLISELLKSGYFRCKVSWLWAKQFVPWLREKTVRGVLVCGSALMLCFWEVADVVAMPLLACSMILDTVFYVLPLLPVVHMWWITAMHLSQKFKFIISCEQTTFLIHTQALFLCCRKANLWSQRCAGHHSPCKARSAQLMMVPGVVESPDQGFTCSVSNVVCDVHWQKATACRQRCASDSSAGDRAATRREGEASVRFASVE